MELNVLLTTFCNNYSRISLAIVLHNNFALNSNLPNVVNRISYLRLGSERCSTFQRYLFYAISPAAVEAEACIGFDRIITSHNREVWSQVLFERDPSRFFSFFFFYRHNCNAHVSRVGDTEQKEVELCSRQDVNFFIEISRDKFASWTFAISKL